MDLIERYVQEVARRLPRRQRVDVARELRSSLEDSLENRAGAPIEQVEEEQAAELLVEFGRPQQVAASYQTGPNYLIGPALYPSFIKTMKVCLAVVGSLILLSTLLDIAGSSGAFRELGVTLLHATSSLQSAFISLLGIVVLIFAIIERAASPDQKTEEEWDPRDLPPITEDRDRVERTGEIIGMVLATVGLLLINFRPDWLQAQVWVNDVRYNLPLMGPGALAQVVWLNLYLVLSVALGLIVLFQGRWHAATRAVDLVISFLLVVFFWRMLHTAQALLPDVTVLLEWGWPAEEAVDFVELSAEVLAPLLWWVFFASLLAATWGSISKLIALSRSALGQRPVPAS